MHHRSTSGFLFRTISLRTAFLTCCIVLGTSAFGQFCAEIPSTLSSLGAPSGCDQCQNTLLPGQPINGGTATAHTLISDLPEAFCSNGVLYSTMPVLPADQNGNPSLALRTQTSTGGFDYVRGNFDVFLFHLITGACSPTISDKRITIYVKNEGTGPISIDAKQIIVTDGVIGTIHEMESTLGRRELADDWDTTAVGRVQTIAPGTGAVVAYSKRFRSTANNLDQSTNINCFGRVRASVTNANSGTSPTQLHVSVVAIDGVPTSQLLTATEANLGQSALSGDSVDVNTAPSGCDIRRAVGTYDTFLWTTPPGALTVDGALVTTRTFQMALWDLASGGCPAGQQSVDMRRYPGYTRPDTIGNYHVDYRINLRLVNRDSFSTRTIDLQFGKADADVGLAWQIAQTDGAQAAPTTATILAAPVRTGWAGPDQASLNRSFLASDGGNIVLPPCSARNVAVRLLVLGNSSLPFQMHVVPIDPPPSLIVDNSDAASTRTGSWGSSANAGFWGVNSLIANTGGGADVNSWRASLPQPGYYDVYAWWIAASNRSSTVPYRVYANNGTQTIVVNQKSNNAQWNYLGTFPFNAGNAFVDVSDTGLASGEFVSADAVRWVYQYPLPIQLSGFALD